MRIESSPAERNAALVLNAHSKQISAVVYMHGQQAVAETLRALAGLIEESEFSYDPGWVH